MLPAWRHAAKDTAQTTATPVGRRCPALSARPGSIATVTRQAPQHAAGKSSSDDGNHLIVGREPAGCLLGVAQPTVHRDLEHPAAGFTQPHTGGWGGSQDQLLRLLRARLIASHAAIFDLDLHRCGSSRCRAFNVAPTGQARKHHVTQRRGIRCAIITCACLTRRCDAHRGAGRVSSRCGCAVLVMYRAGHLGSGSETHASRRRFGLAARGCIDRHRLCGGGTRPRSGT